MIFVPVVVYLADIFRSLFPWPIIVVAFALLLWKLWGPYRIQEWLSSAKLEIPGILKYEGNAELFVKEFTVAQKTVARANSELHDVYKNAMPVVALLQRGLSAETGKVAKAIAQAIGNQCPGDFRLAIYVRDVVFDDRLYQLTEY